MVSIETLDLNSSKNDISTVQTPKLKMLKMSGRRFNCVSLVISFVQNFKYSYCSTDFGKRSLLRKSQHQKPKRTLKKDHYIESVFLVHHYYYNQNIKSVFLVHHYYDKNQTFDVLILPMASKKITTLKIKNIFLSNYLWHITYGYQGLWGGQVRVNQVRLDQIRLGQFRLGWVR